MHDQEPFDRAARRRARDRAAPAFGRFAYLKTAFAEEIAERLRGLGVAGGRILDLGAHDGRMAAFLGDAHVVAADAGFRFARHSRGVMCDEDRLPFAASVFDAAVSAGSLHGVNDLPGALAQVRRAIRPGGVFVASFVAGASLQDLRARLIAAEADARGGVSPRFLPMVDPREAPSLLQRAGFADPVVDVAVRTVRYRGAAAMLADLRGMGESNILAARARRPLGRAAAALLRRAAEAERDADGRIAAHLEIVTMTGKSPAS